MTSLNWLHLTDRHIDGPGTWLWDNVQEQLFEDLLKLGQKQRDQGHGPWDVVMFTGDLAFSGKEDQYRKLDCELDALWTVLQAPWPGARPPLLLAVPGNHDLERPRKGDPTAKGLLLDADARESLFTGERYVVDSVAQWFRAYKEWWSKCRFRPQSGVREGLLPGDFSFVLEKEGVRFGFVGLNTAFLDLYDGSEGKLHVDVRQLQAACDDKSLVNFTRSCELAFLLSHHPPNWLAPEAKDHYHSEIATPERFIAHLCGHLHAGVAEGLRTGFDGEHRLWLGASIFGLEKLRNGLDRKHGYTAGRLERDARGIWKAQLWPRLSVRLQSKRFRLFPDYTYRLQDDLIPTSPAIVKVEGRPLLDAQSSRETVRASVDVAPKSWREAIQEARLWIGASDGRKDAFRQMASKIVEECWQVWCEARVSHTNDVWSDEHYPVRVLSQLDGFLTRAQNTPAPEEVLLLATAPFVHAAVRIGAASWMAGAEPEQLDYTGKPERPRVLLEQIHLARPDLIRRAMKLQGKERRSVVLWMMHRALDRTPGLWDRTAEPPLVQRLIRSINALAAGDANLRWFTWKLVAPFARCVGASLDLLDGEQGLATDRIEETLREGVRLRRAALAYLLCVAGQAALDIRLADETAVEHIGLGDGFQPDALRVALSGARWEKKDDGDILKCTCQHPVIDFVLGELVSRADEVLQHVRQKAQVHSVTESLAILRYLPMRMSSSGVRPACDDHGRPCYRLPHIRFRLDHHRVRELLMGKQLYGDPSLALRELYQNALDACRFRRARHEYLERQGRGRAYDGRIVFRQGADDQGRPFIECTDNGVGMTEHDLERIFSVAGRRFVDMPDFREEQAAWRSCKPPIEFFPNSQFGIGVLSYFMLADALEITSRRFRQDGSLGTLLVARISSTSGLFHLGEIPDDEQTLFEGGTRVRLILGKADYQNARGAKTEISAREILSNLLWIAEFQTEVHDSEPNPYRWPPNVLVVPSDDKGANWRVGHSDLWWCSEDGRLLADGIVTEDEHPLAIVNLRGPHYPKLNVARTHVVSFDSRWVNESLEKNWRTLLGWPKISLQFIWKLEFGLLGVASQVFNAFVSERARIPIGDFSSRFHDEEVLVALDQIGCFEDDEGILRGGWRIPLPVQVWRIRAWMSQELPHAMASRLKRLIREIPFTPLLEDSDIPLAQPGDSALLDALVDREYYREHRRNSANSIRHSDSGMSLSRVLSLDYSLSYAEVVQRLRKLALFLGAMIRPVVLGWSQDVEIEGLHSVNPKIKIVIPLGDVFAVARQQGRPPTDVARHLQALGFNLGFDPAFLPAQVDEADLVLTSVAFDAEAPWLSNPVPLLHVLRAAKLQGMPPADVAHRLQALGFTLGFDLASLPAQVDDADLILVSVGLDAEAPWLSNPVPLGHVLRAAKLPGRPPADVAHRLQALGFTLGFDPASLPARVDEADLVLVSMWLDAKSPWISNTAHLRHVLYAAEKQGRPPADIARRLQALGFTLGFDPASLPARVDEADFVLIAGGGDAGMRGMSRPLPLGLVLHAAKQQGKLPADVAHRLQALGFTLGFDSASLTTQVDEADLVLVSVKFDARPPWIPNSAPLGHVLRAAKQQRKLPADIARRLQALGFTLGFDLASLPSQVDEVDLILVSLKFDGEAPWALNPIPLGHVLRTAKRQGRSPADVARRFQSLGFTLGFNLASLPVQVDEAELALVSVKFNGEAPWILSPVPSAHVRTAAWLFSRSPSEIVRRLESFGFLFHFDVALLENQDG